MTKLAKLILKNMREMGVENMWEDGNRNKRRNCVSTLKKVLAAEYDSVVEHPRYPKGTYKGYCDIVCDGTWIEVKFAWSYLDKKPYNQPNRNFRKHLVGDDESAKRDVTKKLNSLSTRTEPKVARTALLLVCLHSPELSLSRDQIRKLENEAGLGEWKRSHIGPWENPRNKGCKIEAFFWERRVIPRG